MSNGTLYVDRTDALGALCAGYDVLPSFPDRELMLAMSVSCRTNSRKRHKANAGPFDNSK